MLVVLLAGALPARAQDPAPARAVAKKFYDWYFRAGDHFWDRLPQVKKLFDPDLYARLQRWYKSGHVDFDPFINAQMNAVGYKLGGVKFNRDFALIPVTCTLARQGKTKITLVLHRAVDHYEIFNFIYSKDFDLASFLQKNP
jgi:hypothetical protein